MDKRILNFVAVDIETTGFSHIYDSIIQIGAVHIYDGKVVNEFNRYIRTSKIVPKEIIRITGITEFMLAEADTANIVLSDFVEFCGDATIVAHNASFDLRFIRHKIKTKLGIDFTNHHFCTMQHSRKELKTLDNHKLNTIAKYYNIPNIRHHDALNDAKVCADIALCIIGREPIVVPKDNMMNKISNLMNKFFD